MKITNIKKEDGFLKIELVSKDQIWKEAFQKEFKETLKSIEVPGFRKGKVPTELASKKINIKALENIVARKLVEKEWDNIAEKIKDYQVISQIDKLTINTSEEKAEVEISFLLLPEVKLPNYKELKIKRDQIIINDQDIEKEYQHLLTNLKEPKYVNDKNVENGDVAIIDFEGYIDNKTFEGGSGHDYELEIGSQTFIPGFEDQLIGKKNNDQIDVKVKFPSDYPHKEYANKDAIFKVAIKGIKQLNDLSDEDLKKRLDMFGLKSLGHAKEVIRDSLISQKQKTANDLFIKKLLQAFDEDKNAKMEINAILINQEIEVILKQTEQDLKQKSLTLKKYLSQINTSLDDFKKSLLPVAKERIQSTLLIQALAKDYQIDVSEEEFNQKIDQLAAENQTTVEMVKEYMNLENIRYMLQEEKVFNYLANLAN